MENVKTERRMEEDEEMNVGKNGEKDLQYEEWNVKKRGMN
jgi:hypothetical protein